MSDPMGRLDHVRLMDRRICHEDGTWWGECYYEWSWGCRIYIPVFKDGGLGADHRDVYCERHSIEMARKSEKPRLGAVGTRVPVERHSLPEQDTL